jgi:hypothetical protein
MKKLHLLLAIVLSIFFVQPIFGQCTPDPDCVDTGGDGEYCPSEFPNAVEDEYYEQVLTVIAPLEQTGLTLHHVDLVEIENIPPGMNYECQDNDCSFYPATPKCVRVFGTPEIGSYGYYTLVVILDVYIDVLGNPFYLGQFSEESSEVYIEPQLQADFDIGSPSDLLCMGWIYSVNYTGNASENAIYNWNFGQNLTVLSGEGQGPYEIVFEEYLGLDSISLVVEENGYTSPEFVSTFLVDVCGDANTSHPPLELNIHPNPFADHIQISGLKSKAQLQIFDIGGILLLERQINSANTIVELSDLEQGLYILSVSSERVAQKFKIVKR